jgi:Peptidase MA superfamily
VGKTLRRGSQNGGGRRVAVSVAAFLLAAFGANATAQEEAPDRLDRGRFTAVYFPSERTLTQSLLEYSIRNDTFPGLPRPRQHVLVAIAPSRKLFREWVGPGAPEWGAAITFPDSRRIVMQGRFAGADAGDPREVLRHELAHLALHEFLGDAPPRWFDEGYASYAAHEWRREDALAANVALALKGTPTFDELDAEFTAGSTTAQNAYALAYRAVVDLAALDTTAGLARFLSAWREAGSMDRAFRATYGITLNGFEQRWQQRTRRRYGGLALVGDFAIGGLVLLVLVLPLYISRRQRNRQRLAALLAADEVAERAARRSAIEALLRGDDQSDLRDGPSEIPPS